MRRRPVAVKLAVVAAACLISSIALVPGASAAGPPARIDCETPDVNAFDRHDFAYRPSNFGSESNAFFTCTVTDSADQPVGAGVLVRGETTSGPNDPDDGSSFSSADHSCTTGANGACTATVTQSEGQTGTAVICFFFNATTAATQCANESVSSDDPDGADLVRVTWETRDPAKGGIDVEPETAIVPLGSKHVVGATIYDQFGYEFVGQRTVHFEIYAGSPSDVDESTSPSTPDRTCVTSASATCSVTFSSNTLGRDMICVWTNRTPTMIGSNTTPSCGVTEDDEPGVFDPPTIPVANHDSVEIWWQEQALIGGGLDAEPELTTVQPRSKHVVSVKVHDDQGLPYAGAVVKYEFLPGSISANQATRYLIEHDGACITSAAGICSISYKQTNGIGQDWICLWLNGFPEVVFVQHQNADHATCAGEGLTDPDDQAGAFDDPAPLDDDVDMIKIRWAKAKGA